MSNQRKIKFRAWDIGLRRWLCEDVNLYSSEREDGEIVLEIGGVADYGIEFQQFTGRTDKNGKEIYEGDIIKVTDHPDFSAWGGIGEVFWDNEEQSYMYGVKNGWSDLLCTPDEKQLEIIGTKFDKVLK